MYEIILRVGDKLSIWNMLMCFFGSVRVVCCIYVMQSNYKYMTTLCGTVFKLYDVIITTSCQSN